MWGERGVAISLISERKLRGTLRMSESIRGAVKAGVWPLMVETFVRLCLHVKPVGAHFFQFADATTLTPCLTHDCGLLLDWGRRHPWSWPARTLGRGLLLAALSLGGAPASSWEPERLLEAASPLSTRAQSSARALRQLIERGSAQDEEGRLLAINNFFNQRIEFRADLETWGQEDYWASPMEALDKGQGDCEDYAIGKYAALVAAGVPVAKLRLVYVRANLGGVMQAHMVLAYYAQPNAEPLILDNLVPELKLASKRNDLVPVFSFNSEGLWQGVGAQTAGNPLVRLSRWREVLAKVKLEGFL